MVENRYDMEVVDVPDAGMIRKQVDARMAELEVLLDRLRTEHAQLERLAAIFPAGDGPAPPRGIRPAWSAPPAGALGATRADQAVALITARPGLSATDLATAMGVSRNYLYRVLPKLERRGVIRKRRGGYEPV